MQLIIILRNNWGCQDFFGFPEGYFSLSLPDWYFDGKYAAFSQLAVYLDCTTVFVNNGLRNRQTQTLTNVLNIICFLNMEKARE